jgi:hypothetical protein
MTCEHQIVSMAADANGICSDCRQRVRVEHDDLLCMQLRGSDEPCDRQTCPCIRKLAVPDEPWRPIEERADRLLTLAASLRSMVHARKTSDASTIAMWSQEIALDLYKHVEQRRDAEVEELVAQIRASHLSGVG